MIFCFHCCNYLKKHKQYLFPPSYITSFILFTLLARTSFEMTCSLGFGALSCFNSADLGLLHLFIRLISRHENGKRCSSELLGSKYTPVLPHCVPATSPYVIQISLNDITPFFACCSI